MLTLGMRGVGEPLGQDVVAERDGVRGVLPPLVGVRAMKRLPDDERFSSMDQDIEQ